MVGFLTNIPRTALDENGKEMVTLGINMTKVEFLHVSMWGLIDEVLMMKPPKMVQVSVGWYNPKAIQVSRYPLLIVCKGSNTKAFEMVMQALYIVWHMLYLAREHNNYNNSNKQHSQTHLQAHMGTWMHLDHPYLFNWGTLRCSLELLERKMGQYGNHHSFLVPTWRYAHSKFPKIQLWDNGIDRDAPFNITTGWRYSLDFSLKDLEFHDVEKRLWDVFEDREFKAKYGKDINLCAASRRSFGHQGQQDPLQAPCARNCGAGLVCTQYMYSHGMC